ncbi:MAG: hypothetical protein NTY20_02500 [Candidatus Aenigmarchaeota archaeon]|nr:hypothetical protein [Candidatus Aenigmarchaeota archaeon]
MKPKSIVNLPIFIWYFISLGCLKTGEDIAEMRKKIPNVRPVT